MTDTRYCPTSTYEKQFNLIHLLLGSKCYITDVDATEDDRPEANHFAEMKSMFGRSGKLFEWQLKYYLPNHSYTIQRNQVNYDHTGKLYPTVGCICAIYDGSNNTTQKEPGFFVACPGASSGQWMSPMRLSKWLHHIRNIEWDASASVNQSNLRLLTDPAFANVRRLGDLPNSNRLALEGMYGIPVIV
jgi:hypothetical protein